MRLLAIPIAVVGMSACAPTQVWQMPGADQQTVNRDVSICHAVAQGEATQRYPYQIGSPAPFGVPSAAQRDDLGRSVFEAERFDACMQGLGYHRS